MVALDYQPTKDDESPVVLVGKGVMFDSGGLCIKPGKSMYEMKTDMAGGAAVRVLTTDGRARCEVSARAARGICEVVEEVICNFSFRLVMKTNWM